ncbi:MAG TPA: hypothetical protein VNI57_11755, partial [Candidatus Saccharimonadales bacterium]|nr:hypothetical protein [Candidatus Saccharimonadales bacterium]
MFSRFSKPLAGAAVAVALAWAGAVPALAAKPSQGAATAASSLDEPFFLRLQGRLRMRGGAEPPDELPITFTVADSPSGGRTVWSSGPVSAPIHDGFFDVTLGSGGEQPLTIGLFRSARFLRIECNGCVGRRVFPIQRRGHALAVPGLEMPSRPSPAAPKPYLRNLRLHEQRAYPSGFVPPGGIAEAWSQAAADPLAIQPSGSVTTQGTLVEGAWTEIGPSKVTNGQTGGGVRADVSGRVNCVVPHPTDADTAYACGAQGGLWKTTDGGTSWTPLTENFPSLATGAVAIAPSSTDTLYLGTGEANFSIDSYWGAGIFRSTDGGATFSPTAILDPNRAPLNAAAVAAIDVHPANPDLAIAAVGTFMEGNSLFSGGIYRTTDGGGSWERVLGTGLSGGPVVASDVRFDDSDPNVVYAALGWIGGSTNNGVWKSVDSGATFTQLDLGLTSTQLSSTGRINLALAPSDTQILYAGIHNITTNSLLGIWQSTNGGTTWSKRNATFASCGTQCWYNLELAVSPADPNLVFFGGVNLYRSTNGASTFSSVVSSGGSQGDIHVDQHALAFSPSSPARLWIGNDGGVWRTDDAAASLPLNWVNLNTNLALLQFQSVAVPPSDPNIAYGGTQDNGTNRYLGSTVWVHGDDGDGGETAVDFVNPQTVYHTYYGVSFERSDSGGALGSWVTRQSGLNTSDRSEFYVPVEIDPGDSAVLYLGTYRLYRTVNRGDSWSVISPDLTVDPNNATNTGNITAIGLSAADPNVIYVGSSNAQIQMTSDLGVGWTPVAAPPLPDRFVSTIAVHPADANTAWVGYSGFDDPNTGSGHVFETTDRGATWIDVSANLPDIPVNDLVIDPASPQMIYAATDIGPYVSTNGGASWRRYSGG